MDKFFKQNNCDRCGKDLKGGRIMSMFNEDCICMDCKEKERQDPEYKKAVNTMLKEADAIAAGVKPAANFEDIFNLDD